MLLLLFSYNIADKDPLNFIKGLNQDPHLLCEKRMAESAHYNSFHTGIR